MKNQKLNKKGISIQLLKDVKRGLERLKKKRLGAGHMYDFLTGDCCAIGAAILHRANKSRMTTAQMRDIAKRLAGTGGLWLDEQKSHLVWIENDGKHDTPEQRYIRMYAWTCKELENV